jgi:hypothetical protein
LSVWDMACSFVFGALLPVWLAGRAGARPDHPILRHEPKMAGDVSFSRIKVFRWSRYNVVS